jgi:hypothetical protein
MATNRYRQSVSRVTPGCVIFLLDHSFSMTEGLAGSRRSRRDALATAVNRCLYELILMCGQFDGTRHWFDVGVISYTTDRNGTPVIGPALEGELSSRELVSVVELDEHPIRVEDRMKRVDDGAGGLTERSVKVVVWYDAPAESEMAGSPMCSALAYVGTVASGWCTAHPTSFPPIVIHITDGDALDGDPEPVVRDLRTIQTQDGELLLYHCYLSSHSGSGVLFPASEDELPPDKLARQLFRISSPLPEVVRLWSEASTGSPVPQGARGLALNADCAYLIDLSCRWMVYSDLELLFGRTE